MISGYTQNSHRDTHTLALYPRVTQECEEPCLSGSPERASSELPGGINIPLEQSQVPTTLLCCSALLHVGLVKEN